MAGLSSFLALALAATLWVVLCDDEYVAPPPKETGTQIRPAQAAAALQNLVTAVRAGDRDAAADLAPQGNTAAQDGLRALVANARAIPLDTFSLRYLDETSGLDSDGRWSASADIAWAFGGSRRGRNSGEIEVELVATDGRTAIAGLGGDHGLQPVWLSGPVQVRRSQQALVVAARNIRKYDGLAQQAVAVVRRVIPDWRERLVVEVPRSSRGLDRVLGAAPGTFENVAGVTSPPDGTGGAESAVHVFLNPLRMAQLDRLGAQVVVSHEAAHVALDAADRSVPVWLAEGFADYIALRDVRLPLTRTASQIIDQVRREGVPAALPDAEDFDDDSEHFGAAYEAAWLACRILARRVGDQELLEFYGRASETSDFDRLFRSTFGLSLGRFTEEWQRSLSDLAT